MSWNKLLADHRISAEPTSKSEINELRMMVEVNLKDANIQQLSAQGRYEFGYNAARLMATAVIRASGYRVSSTQGHHYFTFQGLKAAGSTFVNAAIVFDDARDKRNAFSYDAPGPISDTDAEDLVQAVTQFVADAEAWIAATHPALAK